MDIKNKIEEILLTDYQYIDCYTVDKLLDLFAVSGRSELLKAFVEFYNYRQNSDTRICYDEIDIYLDSL